MSVIVRRPPALRKGSRLAIVCVGAPEPHDCPAAFNRGIKRLQAAGFEIVLSRHARTQRGYFSGDPFALGEELTELFCNPSIDGIICAGGGIAGNALLPHLDYSSIARHPKVFVGSSNATILLNAISTLCNFVTFHGPNVIWDWGSRTTSTQTAAHFHKIAVKGDTGLGRTKSWIKKGSETGQLVGGNLSSVLRLLGTRYEPNWCNAIFAWEEVRDEAANIAAKLLQLKQHGVFRNIGGMIVGRPVDCARSNGVGFTRMLTDVLGDCPFPVATNLSIGHTALKFTLPIGAEVRLSSRAKVVRLLESAVAQA